MTKLTESFGNKKQFWGSPRTKQQRTAIRQTVQPSTTVTAAHALYSAGRGSGHTAARAWGDGASLAPPIMMLAASCARAPARPRSGLHSLLISHLLCAPVGRNRFGPSWTGFAKLRESTPPRSSPHGQHVVAIEQAVATQHCDMGHWPARAQQRRPRLRSAVGTAGSDSVSVQRANRPSRLRFAEQPLRRAHYHLCAHPMLTCTVPLAQSLNPPNSAGMVEVRIRRSNTLYSDASLALAQRLQHVVLRWHGVRSACSA